MESKWQRRRILIWGKTRPELSKTYKEIVCTGGVFEDTKQLVRLYPIPLRYMDDEKIFSKYQLIDAFVAKSPNDSRPESYKIRFDGIQTGLTLSPNNQWAERAAYVLQPGNIFQSVEAIQERQRDDNTSLGLVKPAIVSQVRAEKLNQNERDKFWRDYQQAIKQMDLPLDTNPSHQVKPLSPPDYRYKIQFRCDDDRCLQDHNFSVLDWEIDALYFRMRRKGKSPESASKDVVDKLNDVCAQDKDLYFFLGNISTHPNVFTIVGLWYPKKKLGPSQPNFLDQLP
ncbi:MAG: hypothetical protein U0Y68_05595 [Blastocatellia bacterium]